MSIEDMKEVEYYTIFTLYDKDLGDYEKGDVVILQMSYPERKYSHLNEFKNQHSHLRHTELIDRTPEWIGSERTWELESTLIRSLFKSISKNWSSFLLLDYGRPSTSI